MSEKSRNPYELPQEIETPPRFGIDTIESPDQEPLEAPDIEEVPQDEDGAVEEDRSAEYEGDDEDDLKELEDIAELLDTVQTTLQEVSAIRTTLNNITVTKEDKEKNLDSYRERMVSWREQGYNTARLESVLETRISDLIERVFVSYERDVGKLQEIEKSLDTLDTTGFKKRESDIRDNLRDPEVVILTLKHMIELEIDIRRRMEMDV